MKTNTKLKTTLLALVILTSLGILIPSSFAIKGPRMENLLIKYYASVEAAYTALKASEIDMVGYELTDVLYADAITDPNICLGRVADQGMYEFDVQNNHTIMTYPGVENWLWGKKNNLTRRALTYLVDKDLIVTDCTGGFTERIDQLLAAPMKGWRNYTHPGWGDGNFTFEYDPDTAASIFDARGYVQGSTPNPAYNPALTWSAEYLRVYPPDHPNYGSDVHPVVMCIRTDDLRRFCAGDLLKEHLETIGFEVDAIYGSSTELYDQVMGDMNFHIYTGGWSLGRFPPLYQYGLMHSSQCYPYGSNYITGFDAAGTPNYLELDASLLAGYTALTYSDAQTAVKKTCGLAHYDLCVNIPLWSTASYWAWKCDVKAVVNAEGYGPENGYSFMNMYKTDDTALVYGTIRQPTAMNIMYSSWFYDYQNLDRMNLYGNGITAPPYDLGVDQNGFITGWNVGTFCDFDTIIEDNVQVFIENGNTPGTLRLNDPTYHIDRITADNVTDLFVVGVNATRHATYDTYILRPEAQGAYDTWNAFYIPPPIQEKYECIDESVANGNNDYVFIALRDYRESYDLTDPQPTPNPDWCIMNVSVVANASYFGLDLDDVNLDLELSYGSSTYVGDRFTLTRDYEEYRSTWERNPSTGDPWTWTDLTSLSAGFVSRDSIPEQWRVTQLYVEVVYAKNHEIRMTLPRTALSLHQMLADGTPVDPSKIIFSAPSDDVRTTLCLLDGSVIETTYFALLKQGPDFTYSGRWCHPSDEVQIQLDLISDTEITIQYDFVEVQSKNIFWYRSDGYAVEPVTGNIVEHLDARNVYASIWYTYALPDCWGFQSVQYIDHLNITDDYCALEMYWCTLSYWNTYFGGTQISSFNWLQQAPLSTFHTEDIAWAGGSGMDWVNLANEGVWWIDVATLDGTPLIQGTDFEIYTPCSGSGSDADMRIITASAAGTLHVEYWCAGDARGYTPGNIAWQQSFEGAGAFYAVDFVAGAGGYLALAANRQYYMEIPPLGEIDFVRKSNDCYKVDIFDVVIVASAYGSTGGAILDSNWFPGADLVPDCCKVDIFDVVTVTGKYGLEWDCPPPCPPP